MAGDLHSLCHPSSKPTFRTDSFHQISRLISTTRFSRHEQSLQKRRPTGFPNSVTFTKTTNAPAYLWRIRLQRKSSQLPSLAPRLACKPTEATAPRSLGTPKFSTNNASSTATSSTLTWGVLGFPRTARLLVGEQPPWRFSNMHPVSLRCSPRRETLNKSWAFPIPTDKATERSRRGAEMLFNLKQAMRFGELGTAIPMTEA